MATTGEFTMGTAIIIPGRRAFLSSLGAALITTKGLFAEALTATVATTEGPFYPDRIPLDTDNNLLLINDAITSAVGEVTWLSGRILSTTGQPLRNVFVEIWQCDAHQSYLHMRGHNAAVDANFQGYGRFLTDSTGRYAFQTIKPVSYLLQRQFRAPHIHVAISRGGRRLLTTQIAILGHKDNSRDQVFRSLSSQAFGTLTADFAPLSRRPAGRTRGTTGPHRWHNRGRERGRPPRRRTRQTAASATAPPLTDHFHAFSMALSASVSAADGAAG
jgi:protocatechuate 3,4-dioxygenase beta subunit